MVNDVSGVWLLTIETLEVELTLNQAGTKLTGTYDFIYASNETLTLLPESNIVGNDVTFAYVLPSGTKDTFTGTVNVDFDFIKGIRKTTANPSTKNWEAHKINN